MKSEATVDDQTISVLKTVCVAGGARPGFNQDSNARLEWLAEAGLLALDKPRSKETTAVRSRRFYRPTKKGLELFQLLEGALGKNPA